MSGQTLSNVSVIASSVGINTAPSTYLLNLANSSGTQVFYVDTSGNVVTAQDITAFNTFSDRRLKDNIAVLGPLTCLEKVNALQPVGFTWSSNQKLTADYAGRRDIGLVAQDIEEIIPEVVADKDILEYGTFKTVRYEKIIPVLIGAIQRLSQRVEELENQR